MNFRTPFLSDSLFETKDSKRSFFYSKIADFFTGHDYFRLKVCLVVSGNIDAKTGMILNLVDIQNALNKQIVLFNQVLSSEFEQGLKNNQDKQIIIIKALRNWADSLGEIISQMQSKLDKVVFSPLTNIANYNFFDLKSQAQFHVVYNESKINEFVSLSRMFSLKANPFHSGEISLLFNQQWSDLAPKELALLDLNISQLLADGLSSSFSMGRSEYLPFEASFSKLSESFFLKFNDLKIMQFFDPKTSELWRLEK